LAPTVDYIGHHWVQRRYSKKTRFGKLYREEKRSRWEDSVKNSNFNALHVRLPSLLAKSSPETALWLQSILPKTVQIDNSSTPEID